MPLGENLSNNLFRIARIFIVNFFPVSILPISPSTDPNISARPVSAINDPMRLRNSSACAFLPNEDKDSGRAHWTLLRLYIMCEVLSSSFR